MRDPRPIDKSRPWPRFAPARRVMLAYHRTFTGAPTSGADQASSPGLSLAALIARGLPEVHRDHEHVAQIATLEDALAEARAELEAARAEIARLQERVSGWSTLAAALEHERDLARRRTDVPD